ncbi:unnamed protein product [Gemmataceae bacterium]|nr:unnamed protein product [Gemmataceae bacterium]VTU02575.1 unnamed protein product [Gemmataceae bacterium]
MYGSRYMKIDPSVIPGVLNRRLVPLLPLKTNAGGYVGLDPW